MDYGVVNNSLISIEAALRALRFEVSASKAEELATTTANRPIMPCLTCKFFAPMSGCTVPGNCLSYESITA
jgi:hypothetical protein